MLELKNIHKKYVLGDIETRALDGVSVSFRDTEFVSVLGTSGSGKTTLLNIVGGLDRYTEGDLVINGKSTKSFTDKDWDTYRNHSIGFVFQSYNLIPHQSVLANVELALTISGVSRAERKRRAADALRSVGLGDQLHKKPSQMSGGQMQRVAIARALVNNPDILLADEPTGALDTETSVSIMNILKEISKDKLVIMVTHNPDLAKEYSTRIVRLSDGKIIDDTMPYNPAEKEREQAVEKSRNSSKKRASMSFFTAISLSFNNLMTKKARTFLTSFAGSIGIIGIALIMSLSSGFQGYIDRVQRDTLSNYPLTITGGSVDFSGVLANMMAESEKEIAEDGYVHSMNVMSTIISTMSSEVHENNLTKFKEFLDGNEELAPHISSIQYSYNLNLPIYQKNGSTVTAINPSELTEMMGSMMGQGASYYSINVWQELLDNEELLQTQYNMVTGRWPQSKTEVVLLVDKNYSVNDFVLYSLGIKDMAEFKEMLAQISKGEEVEVKDSQYSYEDILSRTYRLVLPTDYYEKDENGVWKDMRGDAAYMSGLVDDGLEIKIVGIIQQNPDVVAGSLTGFVGYTKELTEYVINEVENSDIVKDQIANSDVDIFSGIKFGTNTLTMADVQAYIQTLPAEQQVQVNAMLSMMTEEQILAQFAERVPVAQTKNTYSGNLKNLGVRDLATPSTINIYPISFEAKDSIISLIDGYNASVSDEDKIEYTDYVGIMMSSISTIINIISYVLIAFVAISLVVSSIMIGIITYISVLERTKEIGVLRSIGASKRDVSRVFTAETLIIGLVSGILGILVTVVLNIPINAIINALAGISGVSALPLDGGLLLVAISVLLTLIAGLVPSRIAAKKDPVVALRSE